MFLHKVISLFGDIFACLTSCLTSPQMGVKHTYITKNATRRVFFQRQQRPCRQKLCEESHLTGNALVQISFESQMFYLRCMFFFVSILLATLLSISNPGSSSLYEVCLDHCLHVGWEVVMLLAVSYMWTVFNSNLECSPCIVIWFVKMWWDICTCDGWNKEWTSFQHRYALLCSWQKKLNISPHISKAISQHWFNVPLYFTVTCIVYSFHLFVDWCFKMWFMFQIVIKNNLDKEKILEVSSPKKTRCIAFFLSNASSFWRVLFKFSSRCGKGILLAS